MISSLSTPRSGLTLIELLLVVAIIMSAAAIGLSIPKGDRRRADVEGAANELAAYLRMAQGMAMRQHGEYAVVFNISNGRGTSGKVLNNWGGGHWYRLLGPDEFDYSRGKWGLLTPPVPGFFFYSSIDPANPYKSDNMENLPILIRRVSSNWLGEAQKLPAHKVRFLALTDQDNGRDQRDDKPYPQTYPRPWFGWYDAAATPPRLYPWGGYDPAFAYQPADSNRNNTNPNGSGFYYQGRDATISGCLNPADRVTTASYLGVKAEVSAVAPLIFKQNDVRPLVNGDWMDYYIAFRPDGTVRAGRMGEARNENQQRRLSTGMGNDIGDMGFSSDASLDNDIEVIDDVWKMNNSRAIATSYQNTTGYWYITLGPDVEMDTDSFPTVTDAVRSLMPAYRVGISALGDVCVIPVQMSLPSGSVFDTTITGATWNTVATTQVYYQRGIRTNADGTRKGKPVVDCLLPEMMTGRKWWLK